MSLRAVAWDIDGTLVDSEPLHHEALVAACANYGADISDLPDQAFRGVHMRDVWARLSHRLPDGLPFEEWNAAIFRHYNAHRGRLVAAPGALAAFDAFAAMGLAQVCVSNSNRNVVDANLAAVGIAERIVFSISLDDVAAGKPDPTPYLEACRRLALTPREVAAIEDSASGALSARHAGLTVIGYKLGPACGRDVDIGIEEFGGLPALIASRV